VRARPRSLEGQDVAAQQRQARADESTCHQCAGEPHRGGPDPSVAQRSHPGRNIDASGPGLKSRKARSIAPESRLFVIIGC
jgi:hypothetical protein